METDKNKHVSSQLSAYLDGLLSDKDKQLVENHLAGCETCQKELEGLRELFKAFEEDHVPVPSDRLSTQFDLALEREKSAQTKVVQLEKRTAPWTKNLLKIAASVALLIATFQTGRIMEMEKSNDDVAILREESLQIKQTAMLSLMENQSASKRIQGVNYIEEFPNPDETIVKALANRLLKDENDIVRLHAFEALAGFASTETVKSVFVKALEKEKNPSIQVGIIQALVKIQEKKAVGPMQKLLEQEDTQPFVKNEIKMALPKII
ncbi:HEAT repeat domain-containing protein [Flagellimonas myxillae]|uniref:HEAT repeat domain-containing protein n=1 Tax=Flagellimonas myxillae TaxID=2942214 RepID=UPI00201F7CF5|nr:HEAT repeat domain-containing protein [Muricauda myxillae]MCL6266903.1 HEAT repeat domain-containing protein [Muricauda myxillae]